MAVRRLHHEQPESFAFTPENQVWAEKRIALYPADRKQSAVIPLLMRAQEQEGWVTKPAIEAIAKMLDMAEIRVLEVATFYTQFQLAPVGAKAHVQVCGTTPCMLRGSDEIIKVCKRRIAEHAHDLSGDGSFSWEEVECLGACVNAPMVAIGSDTFEDLTAESFEALLDAFERGETPTPGPQNGRTHACPEGGPTSLTDPDLYNGKAAEAWRSRLSAESAAVDAPAPKAQEAKAPETKAAEPSVDDEAAEIEKKLAALPKDATPEDKANAVGERPAGLSEPTGGIADDLKRIKGIGKVNEDKLNGLGVFHFAQIAGWSHAEALWVGTYLAFPGRIDREDWIGQAKVLAEGGDTEFSKRVDDGDVPTSQD